MMGALDELILELESELDGYIIDFMDKSDKKISTYAGAVYNKYNTKIDNIIASTSENAEEKIGKRLVEATTKYMNKSFGALEGKIKFNNGALPDRKSTKAGSYKELISFSYSDYLRLFLFVKLVLQEEDVLLRVSDIIQLNINNSEELSHKKKGEFSMNNAYTYVELEAEIRLDPLLVDFKPIRDFLNNIMGEDKVLNTIYYHSVQGY